MDREPVAIKMSSLTLGTGKVIHADNVDRLELHLNPNDYSNLITQRLRPTDSFSVIRTKQKDRKINTCLPKTYVTRSGSLFLYSGSKIMKDNCEQFPLLAMSDSFGVQGARMALPRQENAPVWKKYVNHRPTTKPGQKPPMGSLEKREKKKYIQGPRQKSAKQTSKRIPYTWNYAITPVKVPQANKEVSVDTVKDLSQALLGYRFKQITDRERYENTVINTWYTEKDGKIKGIGKAKDNLSASWTREWLSSPRRASFSIEPGFTRTETRSSNKYVLLQKARTELVLASKGKVPTNTPLSTFDRKGLGSRERPRITGAMRNQIWIPPQEARQISSPLYLDTGCGRDPYRIRGMSPYTNEMDPSRGTSSPETEHIGSPDTQRSDQSDDPYAKYARRDQSPYARDIVRRQNPYGRKSSQSPYNRDADSNRTRSPQTCSNESRTRAFSTRSDSHERRMHAVGGTPRQSQIHSRNSTLTPDL